MLRLYEKTNAACSAIPVGQFSTFRKKKEAQDLRASATSVLEL